MRTPTKIAIGLLAVLLVSAGQASLAQGQQDAEGVCAMAERHYAAIRAGENEVVLDHHLPDFSFFMADGSLLWSFRSLDDQRTGFQEVFGSTTTNFHIRHCAAQVYGNTAVATYYVVGSVTRDNQQTSGTWRVTEVWVREGSEWKEAHHHESPLVSAIIP